jgi:hypothetical protein
MTAAFVALGAIGVAGAGFEGRLNPGARAALQVETIHKKLRDDGGCNVPDSSAIALPNCVKGAAGVAPAFALWGDSHAAALAVELADALRARHASFIQYTKNSCPPALNMTNAHTDNLNCDKYEAAALAAIAASDVGTVIVASRWQFYVEDSGYDNGEGGVEFEDMSSGVIGFQRGSEAERVRGIQATYRDTILRLLATGKKVVLVYPDPEQGWNVPRYLAKDLMFDVPGDAALTTSYARFRERARRSSEALDSVGEHPNLVRIRPDEVLCDTFVKDRCVAQLGGRSLYYDDDHYSNDGARLIVARILAGLGQAPAATAPRSTRSEGLASDRARPQ